MVEEHTDNGACKTVGSPPLDICAAFWYGVVGWQKPLR